MLDLDTELVIVLTYYLLQRNYQNRKELVDV